MGLTSATRAMSLTVTTAPLPVPRGSGPAADAMLPDMQSGLHLSND
jgi:hypothetical protein